MLTLVENGEIYAYEPIGKGAVLPVENKILKKTVIEISVFEARKI